MILPAGYPLNLTEQLIQHLALLKEKVQFLYVSGIPDRRPGKIQII